MFSCLTSNSENCFTSLWSWSTSDTCEQIFQPRKMNHIPQSCFVAETAFLLLPYMFSIGLMSAAWAGHSIALILAVIGLFYAFKLVRDHWNEKNRPKTPVWDTHPPIMICSTSSSKVFTVHWGLNGVFEGHLPFVFRTVNVGFHGKLWPVHQT